jgi:hypothetical protein
VIPIKTTEQEEYNDNVFMPLNISYPTQKSSDKKLLWFIFCSAIFVLMIIVVVKIHSDFFYSDILGSSYMLIIGVFISIFSYSILIRKLVVKENRLMELYEEALKHEITSINDLWEIYGTKDNIYSYPNSTYKIFLKCEKGYVISRPPSHEKDHRVAFKLFIRQLLQNGYGVEYYNYHTNDANIAPLDDYQELIRNNPNEKLRRIGAELLKECRKLNEEQSSSEIEYFVVTAYSTEDSGYLRSAVENAVMNLEGSLYVDVNICDTNDVVEFLELKEKVSGVNFTELMNMSISNLDQKVVKVVKVIHEKELDILDNDENSSEDYMNEEEQIRYIQELEEELSKIQKSNSKETSSNLLNKNTVVKDSSPMSEAEIEEQLNYNKEQHRLDNEERIEDAPIPVDDDDEIVEIPVEEKSKKKTKKLFFKKSKSEPSPVEVQNNIKSAEPDNNPKEYKNELNEFTSLDFNEEEFDDGEDISGNVASNSDDVSFHVEIDEDEEEF